MDYIEHRFTVDLMRKQDKIYTVVQQEDYCSRKLIVSLTLNGAPYTIPDDIVEYVECEQPDGSTTLLPLELVSVEDNSVVIILDTNATYQHGIVRLKLRLSDGKRILHTTTFKIFVEKAVALNDELATKAEQNAIDNMVYTLKKYESDSEAYAVGTRPDENGVSKLVTTDDPAYHNNSKYYSNQAGNSATDASKSASSAKTSAQNASQSAAEASASAKKIEDLTVDANSVPPEESANVTKTTVYDDNGSHYNLSFDIPRGRAATIEVGEITTVNHDVGASVANVGTSSDAIFDFSIPRGDPGVYYGTDDPTDNTEITVWIDPSGEVTYPAIVRRW